MAAVTDKLDDVERSRLQLEESVAKLRKSLLYWQTWEAEYEGLKEEVLGLGEEHKEAELVDSVPRGCSDGNAHKWLGASWKRLRGHCTERQRYEISSLPCRRDGTKWW